MTAVRREHAGAAAATTLTAQLDAAATTFTLTDATGWPTGSVGPFVVTIDAGTATEERVLCLSRTGTTVTVSSRGWESTSDQLHAAGAEVAHTFSATEADEANIAAVAVAGITGSLVGTTQTQTLTNKTLTSPTINSPTVTTPTMTAPTATGSLAAFGGAWTAYTPTLTGFTATVDVARYVQVGKTVHVQVLLTLTSPATTLMGVSFPVADASGSRGAGAVVGSCIGADASTLLNSVGLVKQSGAAYLGFIGEAGDWQNSIPFTWASGDILGFQATYEAA